ncbi:MAG: acyl-CoA thioesterase, partial [Proteobacteria bacterium]
MKRHGSEAPGMIELEQEDPIPQGDLALQI